MQGQRFGREGARRSGLRAWLLAGLCAIALAACGGGGGGGGSGGATLAVESPLQVDSSTYEGEDIPSIVIHLRVTARPEALAGKTLYLAAALPDAALFNPTPFVSIDSDGLGGVLQLIGTKAPVGARVYSGTITLLACLDAACRSPLEVSNDEIPYRIDVKRGLVLQTDEVQLAAAFGVVPTPAEVAVQLPEDVVSWQVVPTHAAVFSVFDVRRVEDASGARLSVAAQSLSLPLTEMDEYATVTAITASGVTMRRALHMVQRTRGAGTRTFAFQRPTVTFELQANVPNVHAPVFADAMFTRSDSDRFSYVGTTWEWPAAADGHPQRTAWLSAYLRDEGATGRLPTEQYGIELSPSTCPASDCLPAGTYRAVMHYRYSPEGESVRNINHVITLVLTP
ncbi:MAG TPA: hypothetical protein VLI72_03075 [Methylibium sp.]|nr:hypothetical protein [Methylibium sp.]